MRSVSTNPHLDRRLADFERRLELLAAELQELRWLAAGAPTAPEEADATGEETLGARPSNCDSSHLSSSWQVRR